MKQGEGERASQLAHVANTRLAGIFEFLKCVHSLDEESAAADYFRHFMMAMLSDHPIQGATRSQAAIHEAAHLVAYEASGVMAGVAAIRGTTFGLGGWSGRASALERLHLSPETTRMTSRRKPLPLISGRAVRPCLGAAMKARPPAKGSKPIFWLAGPMTSPTRKVICSPPFLPKPMRLSLLADPRYLRLPPCWNAAR
jgi:hypothetical protein